MQFNIFEFNWHDDVFQQINTQQKFFLVDENAYASSCLRRFLFSRLSIERLLFFVSGTECIEIYVMSHWTSNNNSNI